MLITEIPLNLPPAPLKFRQGKKGTEVFDPLRRKWIVLTPEEWVRQHFTAWLVSMGYPALMMRNEVGIRLNDTLRRCDTVVYDRTLHPAVIVEYKAPSVAVTQKVFDQIVRYNMVLQVPFLMVSNGLNHYCCRLDHEARSYVFLHGIPPYETVSGQTE